MVKAMDSASTFSIGQGLFPMLVEVRALGHTWGV